MALMLWLHCLICCWYCSLSGSFQYSHKSSSQRCSQNRRDFSPCVKQRVFTVSSFHSFDVEDTGDCRGDWLLLGPTWKAEYRLCGSVLPPPFISSRGRVWVFFHSQTNSSGLAQGFRMSYIRGLWDWGCTTSQYVLKKPFGHIHHFCLFCSYFKQ